MKHTLPHAHTKRKNYNIKTALKSCILIKKHEFIERQQQSNLRYSQEILCPLGKKMFNRLIV